MKPILILQNLSTDGPGYLARWLQQRGVPFDLRNNERGDALPSDMAGHAGLALLGGEMSVNDPLPSLRQAERLILDAMDRGRPVIGHCLGGQLMAKALGRRVGPSPAPEIGWQPIDFEPVAEAQAWFGPLRSAIVFQWHYESFELPPGATWLARSAACPNQAFSIGPHLGMQFHIEVDADKVAVWAAESSATWDDVQRRHPASVQGAQALREGLTRELPAHQALADQVYGRWLAGVQAG